MCFFLSIIDDESKFEITFVGGVRFEYGIELVGQVRWEGRANLHISLDTTRGWESKEEPWRSQPSEELEERAFLGNCWAGHLH